MILLVKCIDIPDIHLTMTAYKDNSYHLFFSYQWFDLYFIFNCFPFHSVNPRPVSVANIQVEVTFQYKTRPKRSIDLVDILMKYPSKVFFVR